ncbi:hypothetical protein [Cohnella cholangitidis]|uniref:hypothetical protein n=1 Tax=Cohnella cholangitidis TaxID=2598458 RepID=UPI002D21D7D2|nr:hypothetical protein [Cohnella cholangitidis]
METSSEQSMADSSFGARVSKRQADLHRSGSLYWLLPDFMPFMPIDDAAFTALVAGWYARAMERKYTL